MSDDYEYSEIVSRILSRITACEDKKAERISPAVLYELVCSESNDINCYPGSLNDKCCQEAYFISLLSKRYTEGEGHLSFRKALELFFQHMLGKCKGYTKVAILIFDSWDQDAFLEWESVIGHVQDSLVKMSAGDVIKIKVFLISGQNLTPVSIPSGVVEYEF